LVEPLQPHRGLTVLLDETLNDIRRDVAARQAGALAGAVNFRFVSGPCERISMRPYMPGRIGTRCQIVLGRAASNAPSAAANIRRFAVSRCSKHWATLHRVASERQFSCRASKSPNVACVSCATA
jgi:hypothetical protein